jgi:hypothetical protein
MSLEHKKKLIKPNNPLDRYRLNHPTADKLIKVFNHKEIKGAGLLLLSIVTGIIARDDKILSTLNSWATDRITSLAGVDRGPTVLNPYLESLSAISFGASLLYFGGGEIVKMFTGDLKNQGLESLSKKGLNPWKDHTIVIDLTRGVYDAVEELRPNEKVVLVHDGSMIVDGRIEGGPINSKNRRNLNSEGLEHLSDENVISSMNLETASEIIINLCKVDNILGSITGQDNSDKLSIPLEKVFNILVSLKNYLKINGKEKAPQIKILAPDGLDVDEIIKLVGGGIEVEQITPESIFVKEVKSRTTEKVSFDTDINGLSVKLGKMNLPMDKESKIVFVYFLTDDKTILEVARIKRDCPDKTVVACIERKTNLDEAKIVADHVWELPSIVAEKL